MASVNYSTVKKFRYQKTDSGPSAVNKKRYSSPTAMWLNLIAFEVEVHLLRQRLTSPSEGEGFTSPSEVDGVNEDENENEEEQDEDETQTIGAE